MASKPTPRTTTRSSNDGYYPTTGTTNEKLAMVEYPEHKNNTNNTGTESGDSSINQAESADKGEEVLDYSELPTTEDILTSDERFSLFQKSLNIAFPKGAAIKTPFTVFAPTNDAWGRLGNTTATRLFSDRPALGRVVLRHLVAGTRLQIGVGRSELETVGGDRLEVIRARQDIFSENVKIITSSGDNIMVMFKILTKDGVIYAVDNVMESTT